jgi:hypothetical protein
MQKIWRYKMSNEYNKVIEACTSLATIASIQNKLNRIYISTEDNQLQSLLKPALVNLVTVQREAVSRKVSSHKSQCNLGNSPFKELAIYCKKTLASSKPQWQVLAERNGWVKK